MIRGRVSPLCCCTSLEAYGQHETAKDAPQSLVREPHLCSSSSLRHCGAVAARRLPLCVVVRFDSNIYAYHSLRRESSRCSPTPGVPPACVSQEGRALEALWEVVMHSVDIVPLRESQRSTAAVRTSRISNWCCLTR